MVGLIGILGVAAYEGVRFGWMLTAQALLKEAARSALAAEVSQHSLQGTPLPRAPRIWPDGEQRIQEKVLKRGGELRVPVGKDDIAIWHDGEKVYCRTVWTREMNVLIHSFGPVVFGWTIEVPVR